MYTVQHVSSKAAETEGLRSPDPISSSVVALSVENASQTRDGNVVFGASQIFSLHGQNQLDQQIYTGQMGYSQ